MNGRTVGHIIYIIIQNIVMFQNKVLVNSEIIEYKLVDYILDHWRYFIIQITSHSIRIHS